MSSGQVRFLSVLLLVGLLSTQPARGQLQVLARYLFDELNSLEEWEALGPEFEPPDLWGEVRWSGADGHPLPGAMELTVGDVRIIAALGPCLPPAQQFDGQVVTLHGFRKNFSGPDTCTLSFWTYPSVDDCSGRPDGGIVAGEFSNPGGMNRWLPYTVSFVLDEPEIRSLRPVAVNGGNPRDVCMVDSITVQTGNYSEIPLRPTTSLALATLLAIAALWYMNRGSG